MDTKENIFNVPNLISGYRLLVSPYILSLAYLRQESLFAWLLCTNLVLDICDGFIARKFKLTTKFGAALDNLADFGTYFIACYGLYAFRWQDIQPHAWLLALFFSVFMVSNVIGWVRFRRMPGMHLRSCVATGYLQGFFFFVLFAWGFSLPLYLFSIGFGVFAYLEKCAILLIVDEVRSDMKGLYWILRAKKAQAS